MQKTNSKILFVLMLIMSIVFLDISDGYGQRSKKRKKNKEKDPVEINANNLRLAEQFFTEGEKFFILEEYTKSLVFFQRSLELDPDNAATNFKIAEIYNINNDLENALIHASEAVRIQGNNKYYYLPVQFCLWHAKQKKKPNVPSRSFWVRRQNYS